MKKFSSKFLVPHENQLSSMKPLKKHKLFLKPSENQHSGLAVQYAVQNAIREDIVPSPATKNIHFYSSSLTSSVAMERSVLTGWDHYHETGKILVLFPCKTKVLLSPYAL